MCDNIVNDHEYLLALSFRMQGISVHIARVSTEVCCEYMQVIIFVTSWSNLNIFHAEIFGRQGINVKP